MEPTTRGFGYRWVIAAVAVALGAGLRTPASAGSGLVPMPGHGVVGAQAPAAGPEPAPRPIRILFLGEDQPQGASPAEPHASSGFYAALAAPLARRGIQLTYAATPTQAFDPDKLSYYDAILLYATHATITPEQERALVGFVEGGKGLVALHTASTMFPGSTRYAALIGGRATAGDAGGELVAEVAAAQAAHPALQGVSSITTREERFTHVDPAPGNTVLLERVDGPTREPYAWARSAGKGRAFYTALGHDQRTWNDPSFQTLLQRAAVWAVDEPTRSAWSRLTMPEVRFVEGYNVPNYENRDPAPRYQLPFDVAEAMQFVQTPAEFSVELFVAEPEIVKPITFAFDERGRMWIAETVNYPNRILYGAPGDDRIRILEDTDGDGRADKFTVFADRLNIPTSLVFANGGVIVAQPPHMLFLKDTSGDDRADERTVLSTGWGTGDTHAVASNLVYGPDNYVWGVVGYSGFKGEMNGKPLQFGQGMFRFKPDGSAFEFIAGSTNNTWGLGFSETFDVFGSTANNDPSFYVAIPNRYFDGVEGLPPAGRGIGPGYQSAAAFYQVHPTTPYIRQVDVFGGYTAGAGHQLYTARAFPKEYWNRIAFINEPTAHLTGQAVMEKQGASFVARDGWNLVSGAEEWFAPVHAQVGPDGAVWVADWYNFIIQHNPTPSGYSNGQGNAYESSLRDHQRGRIYRIAYKKAPAAKKISLSLADPDGLLSALASDNMLWRSHAQRLLVERGQQDVVPRLVALVRDKTVDAVGINGGATHALWTLHGLGAIADTDGEAYRAAVEALAHPAAGVRKAAAMVLPKAQSAAAAILRAKLLEDRDLHTRLAATLVLSDMPDAVEVGQALYKAATLPENFTDKWLSRAMYIAAGRHPTGFLTSYKDDRAAVPFEALPVVLRLGTMKPDWRLPAAAEVNETWRSIDTPGNWEARGLPDFDGVVWLTRWFEWKGGEEPARVSFGVVRNSVEVYVNGQLAPQFVPPPAPVSTIGEGRGGGTGRGSAPPPPPTYAVPAGVLKAGPNTITVRIQNTRNDGGFVGQPEQMFVEGGPARVPLSGRWHYRVERQTNAGALYTKPGELSAHVAFTAGGGLAGAAGAALKPIAAPAPDVTLKLSVVPGQMKFDLGELRVSPGQLVEVQFSNPDAMQHNFVLGATGSLDAIGAAADALSQSPAGVTQQYVPDIPQVLFSTKLLDPEQSVTFQFRAPAQPGQYPYVCTFPAHWRVMNGTLVVAAPAGRGRGGN